MLFGYVTAHEASYTRHEHMMLSTTIDVNPETQALPHTIGHAKDQPAPLQEHELHSLRSWALSYM